MSQDSANTHVVDLLPPYWAGTLDAQQADRVHAHLTTCAACRTSLAAYSAIGEGFRALEATLPTPSPELLTRVWATIDAPDAVAIAAVTGVGTRARAPRHHRVWLPRLPRRLWIGVGLATALAGIVACAATNLAMGGRLLSYAVPLVAALAIASVARPRGAVPPDRNEKSMFLAGAGLGLAYVLLLALLASAALALVRGGDVRALTLGWLGPTVLLAAASLLGSRLARPTAGAAGACSLCFLHALLTFAGLESGSTVLGTVLRSLWATNPVALALAGLLVLGSVAVPSRAR
jgi:hypothetical protein